MEELTISLVSSTIWRLRVNFLRLTCNSVDILYFFRLFFTYTIFPAYRSGSVSGGNSSTRRLRPQALQKTLEETDESVVAKDDGTVQLDESSVCFEGVAGYRWSRDADATITTQFGSAPNRGE